MVANVNQLSWLLTKWLVSVVIYSFGFVFTSKSECTEEDKTHKQDCNCSKNFLSRAATLNPRVFEKSYKSQSGPTTQPPGGWWKWLIWGGVVRYTITVHRSPYFHELWIRLRWLFMELFSSALWSAKPLIPLKNNVVCTLPVEMWTNNLFFQNFLVD